MDLWPISAASESRDFFLFEPRLAPCVDPASIDSKGLTTLCCLEGAPVCCLSKVWPYFFLLLVGESHVIPCILRSCTIPILHGLLVLELRENAIGVPKHRLVRLRISVSKTSIPSISRGVWLFVGAAEPGSNIVCVLHSQPSQGGGSGMFLSL